MSRTLMVAMSAVLFGCDVYEGYLYIHPTLVWAELTIQADGEALVMDPKLDGDPSLSFTIQTDSELPDT